MRAFIFPGQGSQFPGMGKELYETNSQAKELFESANEILGFRITDIMFNGTVEDLKQTKVTQPSIFLNSVILAKTYQDNFKPHMVAGHSLGEISALVGINTLSFKDGLQLVIKRANAMQSACEQNPSTMAAIMGTTVEQVEKICKESEEIVVPANYNCPGQLVISGTYKGIETACARLKEAGAKRTIILKVGGAFHSPLMEPAKKELEEAIINTVFLLPMCAVYQNSVAVAVVEPENIKKNLISQLTSPVLWSQSIINMINDGANEFIELEPGNVLQGLVRKINSLVTVSGWNNGM